MRWYDAGCGIHESRETVDGACPWCATVLDAIAAIPHYREQRARARAGAKGWSATNRQKRKETGCVMRAQTRASVARTRSWKRKRRAA